MGGLLVGDVFANAARAVPRRVAAALGGDTLTFGELDATANQTARALAARGVKMGDRVVVLAATTLDVVPVFAGAAKLGAVFAPAVLAPRSTFVSPLQIQHLIPSLPYIVLASAKP